MFDCIELVPISWLDDDEDYELEHDLGPVIDVNDPRLTQDVIEVDLERNAYGETLRVILGAEGPLTVAVAN